MTGEAANAGTIRDGADHTGGDAGERRISLARADDARGVAVSGESAALLSMIERAARDPSVDIDRMERLFKMHEMAEARRARASYFSALSAMQSDLPAATRRGTGHNDKRYARFEDVIEALRPHLKAHGFSLTYRIKQTADRITVVGVLGHALGHAEETEITFPADTSGGKNAVQAWASSVSYGKRYVSLTLTGIATDDDDDGKAAGAGDAITDEQAEQIKTALEDTGGQLPRFCAYFKLDKLTDLPAAKFDGAMAMIRKASKGRANG